VTDECAATAMCFHTRLSGAQHVAVACACMIMYGKPMLCSYAESYLARSLVEGHYGRPAASLQFLEALFELFFCELIDLL
jgi:hypothetical protein